MSTDKIEKQIVLRAPRERVWKALADAEAFGQWFDPIRAIELSPFGA